MVLVQGWRQAGPEGGGGCRSFYVVVSDRAEEADKYEEGLIVSSKGKQ